MRDDRELLKKARSEWELSGHFPDLGKSITGLFDRFEQMIADKEPTSITYELPEKAALYQTRYNMVLQAVLNLEPDQVVDWKDGRQAKYTIYFDHEDGIWVTDLDLHFEGGYPPLTDEKNVQPLLDELNAKEQQQ